jgi:predicted nucleic acid-binding protein
MTLVDTGPLVALFDPQDSAHEDCAALLKKLSGPLYTTVPVLTEAFHMVEPDSRGADNLREFVLRQGLLVWFLDGPAMRRTFSLMEKYRDHPMDLADGSLVTAAETLHTRKIFTLDRRDFLTYRVRIGRRHEKFQLVS